MPAKPATVREYLAQLPPEPRRVVEAVCAAIRRNLDPAYGEGITYGMIGWFIPHRLHPAGYHCDPAVPVPFINLAARKGSVSLYLCGLAFGETDADGQTAAARRFRAAWEKTGKRLDMGKSCVRFSTLDEVPLEVIGRAVKALPARTFLRNYLAGLTAAGKPRPGAAGKAAKPSPKPAAKKGANRPGRTPKRGGGAAPKPGRPAKAPRA